MPGSDDPVRLRDAARPDDETQRAIAYRRSLRASRLRRATAGLRRRRVLRGRRSLLVATAGVLCVSAGAVAQQATAPPGGMSAGTIAAAQRALGLAADGIVGPRTRAATKRFQRAKGLIPDGVIGPQTLAALGIEGVVAGARMRAASVATRNPLLDRIAACESGGDPTAVSSDGRYRGKYQFSLQTWQELGGTGDPAQAAEAAQDRMAAKLLRQSGTTPWPNCA